MDHHRFQRLALDTGSSSKPSSSPSSILDSRHHGFATPSSDLRQGNAVIIEGEALVLDDVDDGSGTNTDNNTDDGLMMLASPSTQVHMEMLRKQFYERGTAIKFSETAKTDDGHTHALDVPLPKTGSINAHDGHSSRAHASGYEIPYSQRQRRHSDAEKDEYDSVTGRTINADSRKREEQAFHRGEMRYPFEQTTVDELARERSFHGAELPSLTSELTASPIMEGVQTPIHAFATTIPRVESSPIDFSPRKPDFVSRRSVSQRSFGSMGSVGRRHAVKSAQSSLNSPARSFLAQWQRSDEVAREPEPDEEGQEIGEGSGYIIGRQIGYGGFSVVKEVTSFQGSQRIVRAVKIVRKQIKDRSDSDNDKLQAEFEREVDVWRYLKHRHILPLIAVYDTNFATFCITKLNVGGTLFDLVRARRKENDKDSTVSRGLPGRLVKQYLYQLASALRYLHEDVRVVHRDIKPENCLLDMSAPDAAENGGHVLLCDFGMADFIHNEHRHYGGIEQVPADASNGVAATSRAGNIGPGVNSTNVQGSLAYTAPELLSASRPMYAPSADMWSFGCVAYALLTGSMPFVHEFQPRLVLMIETAAWDESLVLNCAAVKEEEAEQGIVAEESSALELVRSVLDAEPERRWDVARVLESRFLEGCKDLYDDYDDSNDSDERSDAGF